MQGINMKFMSKDNFLAKTQLPFQYPNSMLAAMFNAESERPPAEKDGNGYFFIDRDPELFRVILGYLRNTRLPDDIVGCSLQQVQWEASYYGLDGILKIIQERKEAKEEEEEAKKTEEKKEKLLEYDVKRMEMLRKYQEEDEKIGACPAGCSGKVRWEYCWKCTRYLLNKQTYLRLETEYQSKAADLRRSGVALKHDSLRKDL